MTITEPCPCHM